MPKYNPKARHQARRFAMQALYQWEMTHDNIVDIELQFLATQDMKKVDVEYFSELLHKIPAQLDIIDNKMRAYLDRSFSEIDPVELAIMRIGIYELLERQDVPYRVVINEALELEKKFGAEDGYKYVNSILDRVAHEVRPES